MCVERRTTSFGGDGALKLRVGGVGGGGPRASGTAMPHVDSRAHDSVGTSTLKRLVGVRGVVLR